MNILLVSSKYMPEYSGSGFRAHNLYKRLTAKHPEIKLQILAGSETENDSSTYEYEGFKINRIAAKRYPKVGNKIFRKFQIASNFYAEFKATKRFLRSMSEKPDLIHIFGQNYVSATVLNYAIKRKIPVLIELCNEMDDPHHYVPYPFKFWVTRKPKSEYCFICISERLKSVCLKNGIPEENVWCRPNPINEELFKPVSKEERSKLRESLSNFSENDKLLVYVAKYISRKNHRFLLDVMPHLPEEYKLILHGPLVESGPNQEDDQNLFDEVVEKIKAGNLSERVQAESGFVKNIEEFYKMADVYLFPTKEEGLGTPMLEAIACGVPVVANIIPGITDTWITDGENGGLANLDSEEFAEKIKMAMAIDAEKLKQESEKIISIAGTSTIDKKYFEIMNELVEKETN